VADITVFESIQNVLARIEEIKRTFGVNRSPAAYGQFQTRLQESLKTEAVKTRGKDATVSNEKASGVESPGESALSAGGKKIIDDVIEAASKKYRIPEALIRAVIKQESGFNSAAVSEKGAMGLMQLMPKTADLLGVEDPFKEDENIFGGARYLRELINLYGGNLNEALAAYNAGPNRVIEGVPEIPETKDFVQSVLGYYESFTKIEEEGF